MSESEMIDKHGDAFKSIVLKHLQEQLPESEWLRLRALKNKQSPLPQEDAKHELQAVVTPEQLVKAALVDEGMPLDVLLTAFKNTAVEIEKLEGQPVYYFEGKGIYVWAPSHDAFGHLSVWITHPAYPPGW